MKFTDKTSAYRLKSARTFGVVAVSVCVALISLTPSIAQASQSTTSSKARNELARFVTFYDLIVNPCFKDLESAYQAFTKGDTLETENESELLPEDCNLSTGLLRKTFVPTKAFPSLAKINSLTASWISDARVIAGGLNDAVQGKKFTPAEQPNIDIAVRKINPVRTQILNSIQVAITSSKSHSIGKLPTIPKM